MTIPEIKSELTIQMVLSHYGLRMQRGHQLCCPFHEDKTPSMRIYLKTNTFCCFSSNCSAGTGDVIDFIQLKEKCSKHEAIVKAKTLIGATEKTVNQFSRQAMMMRFWESCREGIKRSPKAQEYLTSRGLASNAAGYCGEKSMKHWALPLQKAAAKYGLQQKGSPHFQQCVIFPLLDAEGKPASFYGRAVGEKKHVYLPGGHCGLYPAYPKETATTVILTESIIDAASLQPHVNYAVLALYGTNGITAEHWQALGNLEGLKEIILFLDGDEAGKTATLQLSEKLHSRMESLIISNVETPDGEDVNSLLVSHTEEAENLFEHLLKERKTLKVPKEMAKIIAIEKAETKASKPTETTAKTSTTTPKSTVNFNSSNPLNLLYDTTEVLLSVKGGLKLDNDWQAMSALKVSLHIENKNTGRKYRSKIDLYEGKQVQKLAQEAAEALNTRPQVIQSGLEELTDLLEAYREKAQQKQREEQQNNPSTAVPLAEKQACLDFLTAPCLLENINAKIGEAGVTGEEKNRLFLFGIATSYKMPVTLHALIQGSSGSGKTHLLERISSFIPPEDCQALTRVTESSFYNFATHELSHTLICFEDLDGLKEEALLAVRELISRGQLTSSTSGKDEQGNIQSYVRTVYGPIASLSCTTKGEIYEDNMGRCFLVAVDESAAQTQNIIAYQNKKAAGLINHQKEKKAVTFLQNCVRLLKPFEVVNPYAQAVQLPAKAHKIRRLNGLYQHYVQQITLLHQYQRQQDKQGRLISTVEDLQLASELMFESIILKVDELNGSLRQFFERLKKYLQEQNHGESAKNTSFIQREIRQALNISKTQLHRNMQELLALEYIQQCGGYSNRGYQYKIVYWDDNVALRKEIKTYLEAQLAQVKRGKSSKNGTPEKINGTEVGTLRNTNGTPQEHQKVVKLV